MLNFNDLKEILKDQDQANELFQTNELDTELKRLKLEQEKLKTEQLKLKNNQLQKPTPKPPDTGDKTFLIGVIISVVAVVIQAIFFIFLVR